MKVSPPGPPAQHALQIGDRLVPGSVVSARNDLRRVRLDPPTPAAGSAEAAGARRGGAHRPDVVLLHCRGALLSGPWT